MQRHLCAAAVCVACATGQEAPSYDWLLDAPRPAVAELTPDGSTLVLHNGILRATFRLGDSAALVSLESGASRRQLLRAPQPLASATVDGSVVAIGGFGGQPNRAFLASRDEVNLDGSASDLRFLGVELLPMQERLSWPEAARTRPIHADHAWPPRGVHAAFCFGPKDGGPALAATVHVELYEGLPLYSQRLELANVGPGPMELGGFVALQWSAVEKESRVEPERADVRLPDLHVETDFAFHAMTGADGSAHCVRWLPEPDYQTQVNYRRETRCLLQVGPDLGPAQTIAAGATFSTCTAFVLCQDDDDDRRSLALRRMYRTLAPWTLENPLMLHLRTSEPEAVRAAIDQCAAVGFEMVILSFGSGFAIEDDSQQNLDRWKAAADYAHARGVQIGGYSLLSSRRIEPDMDNCIDRATGKPGNQIFGHAPALASAWGQRYFEKLRRFFDYTGFDLLEHDGSYPGDTDAMARPPLQKGYEDSQWVQHRIIADFYRWCRGRGIYLNVPDWYFLNGSNKTGMGYRETNWSLPRAQQVLHTRQNLWDGMRHKTASMGWMFVPLSEYHGGGEAATIEPLAQHLDHYRAMLQSNLYFGAQACWRGPRLFDTAATRDLVAAEVAGFKARRRTFESDVVLGSSRRADGRWLDWCLHADPHGPVPGLLAVFNPTAQDQEATLTLSLYYTGLVGRCLLVDAQGGLEQDLAVDGRHGARIPVRAPAGEARLYELRRR